MKINKSIILLVFLIAISTLPIPSAGGGICASPAQCPDPNVMGGLTSCLQRTNCIATPGNLLRTDGPCSYRREYEGEEVATEWAVINGEQCYRQYNVFQYYDYYRWWKIYVCTYDNSGCNFCMDRGTSAFRGENVDGMEAHFGGLCAEYVSWANAQWHCNGVLT